MNKDAINNNMDTKAEQESVPKESKRPDERGGILIQSHIKIFDPENQEVFVNGRA